MKYAAFCKLGGGIAPSSLLTNLVAYWKLEEASGNRIDATGRGNDLTPSNITQANGIIGYGAGMTRSPLSYLASGLKTDFATGGDITMDGWFTGPPLTAGQYAELQDLCPYLGANQYLGAYLYGGRLYFTIQLSDNSYDNSRATGPIVGSWNYIAFGYDSTNQQIWYELNGNARVTKSLSKAMKSAASSYYLFGDNTAGGTYTYPGIADECGVWQRLLTHDEVQTRWNNGIGIAYPFSGQPTFDTDYQLVFDGDSLTNGTPTDVNQAPHGTYPYMATYRLSGHHKYTNNGEGGKDVQWKIDNASANIDPLFSATYTKNILIFWTGINDMRGNDSELPSDCWNKIIAYCTARKSAHAWKIIVCTISPTKDSYMSAPELAAFPARRAALNALIVANWAATGVIDGIADIGADATIGGDNAPDNTTYYWDKLHMYAAGYSIVANLVDAAVEAL